MSQGMWAALEAGKGRDFPLGLPEEMQPCQHLDFSPLIFISNSDLQISEIINLFLVTYYSSNRQ